MTLDEVVNEALLEAGMANIWEVNKQRKHKGWADSVADEVAAKVFAYEPVRLRLSETEASEFHAHVQGVVGEALNGLAKIGVPRLSPPFIIGEDGER